MKTLSVIIPAYNECKTIKKVIQSVESVHIPDFRKEIIIVDDYSTDGTREILRELPQQYKVLYHSENRGKGAALRTGFASATGDYIVIQDADLEYNPEDFSVLLEPLLAGNADVVYGSRFVGNRPHRVLFFWHYVGNKLLTVYSNMMTDLNLTDMETCYKMFSRKAMDAILPELKSNRFTIEPEITARVAKKKLRVYEVGISYHGRTYAEGKKIGWKDGFSAIWAIFKFNVFK